MPPEPTPAETKPNRRRFTISLRALMILVLIVGGGTGWKVSRASKQRKAVAALKELSASITYDYNYSNGVSDMYSKPWAPEWLRKAVGDEYFQEVTAIDFALSKVKLRDADLACLADLDRLESLSLTQVLMQVENISNESEGSQLSDACLDHLQRLPRLKILSLNDTPVTDAGLVKLARMTGLEELDLDDTKVTVAGLASLKPSK